MKELLVRNSNKRGNTTVTVKVSSDTKSAWEKFCINNDINQSATLTKMIESLIKSGEQK